MQSSGWKAYDTDVSKSALKISYIYCQVIKDLNNPQECTPLSLAKTTLAQGLEENNYEVGIRLEVCDPMLNCRLTDFHTVVVGTSLLFFKL